MTGHPFGGMRRIACGVLCVGAFLLAHAPAALAAPPEVRTGIPFGIEPDSATLSGRLNENVLSAEPGTYEFLYKATPNESTAECESAGASKAPVPPRPYLGAQEEDVSQEVTGLAPNTTYVVCLAAENEAGERTVGPAIGFTTAPQQPVTEAATEVTARSARLQGTLEPPGTTLEYQFQYNRGSSCAGGLSTALASGEGSVSAVVEGLTPGTTYTFCLVAFNAGGFQQTIGEPVLLETLLAPPTVRAEYASDVSAHSAMLHATINPDGPGTTYHFEYGSTGAYGSTVPVPEGRIGPGLADVTVGLLVEGLSPGTTYHYRVVASNELGEVPGSDRVLTTRTGEGSALLDDRGWEMVSPANKHGAALEGIALDGGAIQASVDGSGLAYISRAPVDGEPAGNRSFAEQQSLAIRSAGVWSTQDIATQHEAVAGLHSGELSEYRLFSPTLSTGALEPSGSTPLSPQASERTPYLREASGQFLPLVNPGNVAPGTKFGAIEEGGHLRPGTGVRFVTASPDLSHVLLSSRPELTAGFETGGEPALYEWFDGALRPVSVLTGEASAATEGGVITVEGLQLLRNAMSVEGSRVFFGTAASRHLFMRDVANGRTVPLDTPEAGAEGGGQPAFFQGASANGARMFFTDASRLTVGSIAMEGFPDLYSCDLEASVDERSCAEKGDLRDITIPANPGEPAGVLGAVLGYSSDGQSVYFVANGVLSSGGVPVAGATQGGCFNEAQGRSEEELDATSCNLYLWHDGVTRLVAVLSGEDFPDWAGRNATDLGELSARVSPNGRFLAFMSRRSLTGYDNRDSASGVADEEVFLYDATSGRVVCASCDPTGARPTGIHDLTEEEAPPLLIDRPNAWAEHWLGGSIPGWTSEERGIAQYQSRYLSDEGRLFFNSPTGLVPSDANGIEDVYEFEPEGTGSCSNATASGVAAFVKEVAGSPVAGCVGLISSGTSSEESAFLDAAASGPGGHEAEDVFFLTTAPLSNSDVDGALDIYDAHICSSASPCPSSATTIPPACTTADSCRPSPEPLAGVFGSPASATSPSAGNLVPSGVVARKPLTRAQKLRKALAACRKKANRKKRAACERQARRRYGAPKPKKRAAHKRRGKR
jgi:hypothetical protein